MNRTAITAMGQLIALESVIAKYGIQEDLVAHVNKNNETSKIIPAFPTLDQMIGGVSYDPDSPEAQLALEGIADTLKSVYYGFTRTITGAFNSTMSYKAQADGLYKTIKRRTFDPMALSDIDVECPKCDAMMTELSIVSNISRDAQTIWNLEVPDEMSKDWTKYTATIMSILNKYVPIYGLKPMKAPLGTVDRFTQYIVDVDNAIINTKYYRLPGTLAAKGFNEKSFDGIYTRLEDIYTGIRVLKDLGSQADHVQTIQTVMTQNGPVPVVVSHRVVTLKVAIVDFMLSTVFNESMKNAHMVLRNLADAYK